MVVDRKKINRGNRNRGRADENDCAKHLRGVRFLANTGGPIDVKHDWLGIQTKGGNGILSQSRVFAFLDKAKERRGDKLPCIIVTNHRPLLPSQRIILFDLSDFSEWFFKREAGGEVTGLLSNRDWLGVEHTSGNSIIRQDPVFVGLASARAGSVGQNKLPCVVLYNRRAGKPIQKAIAFLVDEFADWFNLGDLGTGGTGDA